MADTLPSIDQAALAPQTGAPAKALAGLEGRLSSRQARVGVAGLGAVGLPLADLLHAAGFPVIGIDPNATKRAQLAAGRAPLAHQAHLDVEALASSPRFTTVASPEELHEPLDVLVICVPTDLDEAGEPDLTLVRAASAAAATKLAPEAMVVLESTTWPGTTRQVVGGTLRAAGRRLGTDLALVFSPERVDPGRQELASIPKLVGGLCPRQGELGEQLYRSAFEDVRRVSSPEVAEAAKLLENVYRAVNIALVNELKGTFRSMGLDVWEVLDAAASKPFGFQRFDPGPGVGGHCIPVDPVYLSWAARRCGEPARLVELAGKINRGMPAQVARVLGRALGARGKLLENSSVLLLGLAYKSDVDGVEHSPAVALAEELDGLGASVRYHDAKLPRLPAALQARASVLGNGSTGLCAASLEAFDAVVLVTAHGDLDLDLVARSARLVIDTRGVLREAMLGDPRYVPA